MKILKKAVAGICVFAICFAMGCGGTSNNDESAKPSPLETPIVQAVGNVLYWNKIENAVEYRVIKNGETYVTTKNLFVRVDDLAQNSEFSVVAKASNQSQNSKTSDRVLISRNTGFTEEESLTITLSDENETNQYSVPSNINCVTITGTVSEEVNAKIEFEARTSDIFIQLNGVSMTAGESVNCLGMKNDAYDETSNYSAIIKVTGENHLTCKSVTKTPGQPAQNTEIQGGTGYVGGSPILFSKLAIIGDGSLELIAGNGGNGGKGANSAGFSSKRYGFGGNGGTGGSGVYSAKTVLAMDYGGIVRATAGIGGNGGEPGANGSIVSSIWGATWDSYYGQKGADGSKIRGEFLNLQGVLE